MFNDLLNDATPWILKLPFHPLLTFSIIKQKLKTSDIVTMTLTNKRNSDILAMTMMPAFENPAPMR